MIGDGTSVALVAPFAFGVFLDGVLNKQWRRDGAAWPVASLATSLSLPVYAWAVKGVPYFFKTWSRSLEVRIMHVLAGVRMPQDRPIPSSYRESGLENLSGMCAPFVKFTISLLVNG